MKRAFNPPAQHRATKKSTIQRKVTCYLCTTVPLCAKNFSPRLHHIALIRLRSVRFFLVSPPTRMDVGWIGKISQTCEAKIGIQQYLLA